jgi:hypothetical protein
MFSSFLTKSKQDHHEEKFIFPQYPCYAVVVEHYLTVYIEKYFSGALDDKLAIVRLFEKIEDAVAYLKDTPSAKGGYLLCLDQDLETIKQIMHDKKGFGERIVKAINFDDYIGTTSEFHPLPSEQVRVLVNPHHVQRRTPTPDLI